MHPPFPSMHPAFHWHFSLDFPPAGLELCLLHFLRIGKECPIPSKRNTIQTINHDHWYTVYLLYRIFLKEHLKSFCLRDRADLEMRVGRFRLKLVHNVVMWTYVICQSFSFNELFLVEFWISAPWGGGGGVPRGWFSVQFCPLLISLLAMHN